MLFKNIFLNITAQTSTKIFFCIALYPLLYLITLFLPTNFMQVGGIDNGMSGLDFYFGVVIAQAQFAIPLILVTYFVSLQFFDEINTGKLILYKDINRGKLLHAKMFAILAVYAIYYVILFLSSMLIYFFFLKNFDYASGNFLPTTDEDLYLSILSILGTFGVSVITVIFAIALSTKLSTGYTILGVILLYMIIAISPLIQGIQQVFPNGYTDAKTISAFITNLVAIFLLTIFYSLICYIISLIRFKKIEY